MTDRPEEPQRPDLRALLAELGVCEDAPAECRAFFGNKGLAALRRDCKDCERRVGDGKTARAKEQENEEPR